jgi:hypothetical protein
MAKVYSKRLASGTVGSTSGPAYFAPAPGLRWVLRDIRARNDVFPFPYSCGSFEVFVDGTFPIFTVPNALGFYEVTYGWEGHQVSDAGELVVVQASADSWEFTISGYELTLP